MHDQMSIMSRVRAQIAAYMAGCNVGETGRPPGDSADGIPRSLRSLWCFAAVEGCMSSCNAIYLGLVGFNSASIVCTAGCLKSYIYSSMVQFSTASSESMASPTRVARLRVASRLCASVHQHLFLFRGDFLKRFRKCQLK